LLHQTLTRKQPVLVGIDVDIAGEGSTAQFTAIATMAMGEGSNFINLESDASAEATAFDHLCNPIRLDGQARQCREVK
jgi:hypothetical protein